jgi:single-stranded DNA-binding protein
MSSCENVISLIGHVGSDPDDLKDDVISVKFYMYTNKSFYSNKKKKFIQITEKHLIKAWKQNAEYARNNIGIGDYVRVVGELHYHKFIVNGKQYINPEILTTTILKLNKLPKPKLLPTIEKE